MSAGLVRVGPRVNLHWLTREKWPLEPPGHQYLCRAITTLAPLIADGWEGNEFGALPLDPLPADTERSVTYSGYPHHRQRRQQVREILATHRPDLKVPPDNLTMAPVPPPPIRGFGSVPPRSIASAPSANLPMELHLPSAGSPPPPPPAPVASVDWAALARAAIEAVQAVNSATAAYEKRRDTVAARLIELCMGGEFEASYRSLAGGPRETFDPRWWESEDWLDRFKLGVVDLSDPYMRRNPSSNALAWIFLTNESVQRVSRKLEAEKEARNPPPPWAFGRRVSKAILNDDLVRLEAQRRIGGPCDLKRYVDELEAMSKETAAKPIQADSFRRVINNQRAFLPDWVALDG